MSKKNPGGKISASVFMWMGLMFILTVVLIFMTVKGRDTRPLLQDFVGNITKKTQILSEIQADLFRSEQAEKSAVMADTDEASTIFADQSRRAAESVEHDRRVLESLIEKDPTDKERKLFGEFSESWSELQKIDREILQFAVQNTNLKAMALSFGKGGEAMRRFENASETLIASGQSAGNSCRAAVLAAQALLSGFKMYNLHALHIAEPRDEKMDEIEAQMHRNAAIIDVALRDLADSVSGQERSSLEEARAAYAELMTVTAEVVSLSRRNTNVKSFQLSLGRKRRIAAQCDTILISLLETVRDREFKATR
jgi:hypothetical protein